MSDIIIFEGNLEKESLHLKTFRKRWIVLKNDKKLYSFKSNKISEIIDISSCKHIKISNKSNYTFTLIFNDNKQRKFKASDQIVMNQWIKNITKAINTPNHNVNALLDEKKDDLDISLVKYISPFTLFSVYVLCARIKI